MSSLFTPTNLVTQFLFLYYSFLIKATDSLETQLATAANSCHVTEALMRWCDQLWMVPAPLLTASQRKPPPHRRIQHT